MSKLVLILAALVLLTGSALAQTTDLFISEYVEGSSYNKAIEIYNGTADPLDLGQYTLSFYFNGNTSGDHLALDSVTLQAGETFVVTHSSAEAGLLELANQISGLVAFNGDDVVILEKNGQVIDSMGILGVDPGSYWSCAEGNTQNHTLRRRSDVCRGDTDETDDFDICVEWVLFSNDTFDGLGAHETDCTSVGTGAATWGTFKAIYR